MESFPSLSKVSPTKEAPDHQSQDESNIKNEAPQQINKDPDGGQDATVERILMGLPWFLVNLAVLSPTFLYALDNTVMANVRPSIIDTFGQLEMITWLSVSYPMGELGANPLWGNLNEQFSSKVLYLVAVFIFEVGSAVSGSAQSMEAVIIGRAIAGFGGSGIYVGTINIITGMTTPFERTQYLNYVAMSWSLGTVLGPIIGGAFADSPATWRWAFYINLCIAAFSVPICIWLVPSTSRKDSLSIISRIGKIDYLGAALFLGGVVSVIIVLGSGGADYDWDSPRMIALYVVTIALWIAFGLQQGFSLFTSNRIFPLQLVCSWEMIILFFWTAMAIANVVVTIYSLPLFFQFTFGDSSLRSGVYTLPFIASIVVSAGIGGPLFAQYPIYMLWFAGASILTLIANALLSTTNSTTSRGIICGYTVLQGFGIGPVAQLGYTVGQSKAKASHAVVSQVTAFLTCAQMAGLALSLGIATSVFLNYATTDIAVILPNADREFIQATINGVRTGLLESLPPAERRLVQEAVATQLVKAYYMNIAGSAGGLLTSLAMKRERLLM